MSAREIIALGYPGDSLADCLGCADIIIEALTAAGYSIIRDDENHKATVEREKLRGHWHGVFLDGRNEHGSHVLMLPQRSIELEQDSNGDFLKQIAETILCDAEEKGFKVGNAVVANFDLCLDEGFFSHYEFAGVSAELTAMFYGTAAEQQAQSLRSLIKENGPNG